MSAKKFVKFDGNYDEIAKTFEEILGECINYKRPYLDIQYAAISDLKEVATIARGWKNGRATPP